MRYGFTFINAVTAADSRRSPQRMLLSRAGEHFSGSFLLALGETAV
jgi:hypothetical protein